MTYSSRNDEELTKVQCSMCGGHSILKDTIERYDPGSLVMGWCGEMVPALKTFCSKKCMEKYFGKNQ